MKKIVNKKIIAKRKRIVLVFLIILAFLLLLFINNTQYLNDVLRQQSNNQIIKNDRYTISITNSYEAKKSDDQISLSKDQVWDEEGYNLRKGVSAIIEYKDDANLSSEYVKNDPKTQEEIYQDLKINSFNIGMFEGLKAEYSIDSDTNIPLVTKMYLQNNGDILEISYAVGTEVTKDEYERYRNEMNELIKNVQFSNK